MDDRTTYTHATYWVDDNGNIQYNAAEFGGHENK